MHYQTTRTLARNGHIAIAVFQFFYIYTPLHHWAHGLTVVQWVTFPLLVISGVWLRCGQRLWRWWHQSSRSRSKRALPPHADSGADAAAFTPPSGVRVIK